jgi:hypothetical protein
MKPYNSWGNGSAMRVSPVGFAFESEDEVLKEAKKKLPKLPIITLKGSKAPRLYHWRFFWPVPEKARRPSKARSPIGLVIILTERLTISGRIIILMCRVRALFRSRLLPFWKGKILKIPSVKEYRLVVTAIPLHALQEGLPKRSIGIFRRKSYQTSEKDCPSRFCISSTNFVNDTGVNFF